MGERTCCAPDTFCLVDVATTGRTRWTSTPGRDNPPREHLALLKRAESSVPAGPFPRRLKPRGVLPEQQQRRWGSPGRAAGERRASPPADRLWTHPRRIDRRRQLTAPIAPKSSTHRACGSEDEARQDPGEEGEGKLKREPPHNRRLNEGVERSLPGGEALEMLLQQERGGRYQHDRPGRDAEVAKAALTAYPSACAGLTLGRAVIERGRSDRSPPRRLRPSDSSAALLSEAEADTGER